MAGKHQHSLTFRWLLAGVGLVAGVVGGLMWAMHGHARTGSVIEPKVLAKYPHDPNAFTQGLVLMGNTLYEGTGGYGFSVLRDVDLTTGQVRRQTNLHAQYFGEGIAVWQNWIIQLTWKEQVAIVYDRTTFQPIGQFRYRGEGWGLTHDGTHLYMSDGTPTVKVLDPQTFQQVRKFTVQANRRRVSNLNELEFVAGELWANVWQAESIVRIDPATGAVLGWIDLRTLPRPPRQDAVANGIAYDPASDTLLVTGKLWPTIYRIARPPSLLPAMSATGNQAGQ